MTRTLVTGASGTLGRVLLPKLVAAGHEVRAASRSPPADGGGRDGADGDTEVDRNDTTDTDDVEWMKLDLADGTGFEAAVADVDVVVHAASAPTGDTEAVDVEGTERLVDAAAEAGVENLLYTSIVGIDDIPYSYYDAKVAAETAIESSDVPSTIVRATQFHAFLDEMLGYVAKLPVWPLPTRMRIQPVDEREVANVVVEHATTEARGRTDPVGGPEVHTLGELARAYREARGLRRPIVRLPIPSRTVKAFGAGHATCPDHAVGTVTWDEWLARQYGGEAESSASPAGSPS